MEWVRPNAHVKEVLPRICNHVLVRRDTCCFQGLAVDLLALVRDKVDRGGELVAGDLLLPDLVDADLRVRHTAAEARLRVGLVLLVAVAARGSAAHGSRLMRSDFDANSSAARTLSQ